MFNRPRKTLSLEVYEVLNNRKKLTHCDLTKFRHLRKGYEGELIFANVLNKYLEPTCFKIFDLNLAISGSTSQYDVLLLMNNTLLHFEVKNLSGDYYTEDDNWFYLDNDLQINNPIHQTTRANRLLNQFLFKHQFDIEVKSFTIFIHPQFYLYHAPINRNIIFPSQIRRFFLELNKRGTKHYAHADIYQLLIDSHVNKLPHEVLPEYSYEELNKGIFCDHCFKPINSKNVKILRCNFYGTNFTIKEIIKNHTIEFATLFPDQPITAHQIYLWTGRCFNKKTISKYLKLLFNHIPNGKFSYYQFK